MAPAVDLLHQQVESAGGHVFSIDEYRQPWMIRCAEQLLDILVDPGEGGAGKMKQSLKNRHERLLIAPMSWE
jgi:hypothetical protein